MIERFKQWAEEFLGAEKEVLSDTNAEVFLSLLYSDGDSFLNRNPNQNEYPFMVEVAIRRSDYLGLVINDQALIGVSLLCKTPGALTMYLSALKYLQVYKDMGEITMEKICIEIFPFGFLTDEAQSRMWDKQKTDRGNLLDLFAKESFERKAS